MLLKVNYMTDIGELKSFLGMKIEQTSEGLFLSQRVSGNVTCSFWNDGVQTFYITHRSKPEKHEDDNGEVIIKMKPYKELVGCLRSYAQYVMI